MNQIIPHILTILLLAGLLPMMRKAFPDDGHNHYSNKRKDGSTSLFLQVSSQGDHKEVRKCHPQHHHSARRNRLDRKQALLEGAGAVISAGIVGAMIWLAFHIQ